jgi:hypothetical protein
MTLWKLIISGTFAFNANQTMNFNDLTLRQDIAFHGAVDFETHGYSSEELCNTQLAAIPNTFTYSKMTITVQAKKCVEDKGPTT